MLNTSVMDSLFAGLVDHYGPNLPMELWTNTISAPVSVFNEGELGFSLNLDMKFGIMNNETAIDLNLNDIDVLISVNLTNFLIYV